MPEMSELGSSIHPVQQAQGAGAALKHALGNRDVALAVMTLILFAVVTASFPQFAQAGNIAEILDDSSILILLALGQMLVILTRAIDLSVAANLALSGMIAALCNKAWPDANVSVCIAIALTCGSVLGA